MHKPSVPHVGQPSVLHVGQVATSIALLSPAVLEYLITQAQIAAPMSVTACTRAQLAQLGAFICDIDM